jgi:lauroyl/myristoyl acyltransferase
MSAGGRPRSPAALAVRAAMWLDYRVVMPALARVSWGLALWWGRRRGDLLHWWRGAGREVAIDNVVHAHHGRMARAEATHIVRRSYRAQKCEEAEAFFFPSLDDAALARVCALDGREHLERALERGRGALVFSSHYGSVCLAMLAFAYAGWDVNVLARGLTAEENPGLGPVVRRYAEHKVATLERALRRPFIVAGAPGATMKARNALKRGELVYILLSVPPELANRRARVTFLGHPAEVPLGAEFLAEATGAPLVPFAVHGHRDGRTHTVEVRAEVPGPDAGEGTMQRCIDAIEEDIRRDPGQFFMWEFARSFWIPSDGATGSHAPPATRAV